MALPLLPLIATGLSAAGSAAGVYSTYRQSKDAQAAADYNAKATRQAARTASEDARQNALRTQEKHRKHLGQLKARMFSDGGGISGSRLDLLNETTSDLQMRILDNETRTNRQQTAYANQAFRYEDQADKIGSAMPFNVGASAVDGFVNVYDTGRRTGLWGQEKEGQVSAI